jgi:hypothetical protein
LATFREIFLIGLRRDRLRPASGRFQGRAITSRVLSAAIAQIVSFAMVKA